MCLCKCPTTIITSPPAVNSVNLQILSILCSPTTQVTENVQQIEMPMSPRDRSNTANTMVNLIMRDGHSDRPTSQRSSNSLGLFKKNMLSLRGPSHNPLRPEEMDEEENRDPIPDDPRLLEERLNYHLGELDRLRTYVKLMNELICENIAKHAAVKSRVGPGKSHTPFPFSISLVHTSRPSSNAAI